MDARCTEITRRVFVGVTAVWIAAFGIFALGDPGGSGADSHDLLWVGHADLQGRTAYQPTLHAIDGKVYLFVGHFSGQSAPNPVTGTVEPNGTTITDVTDPARPRAVAHIPSANGAQMVRVCDGGRIGEAGKHYMLRSTGSTHEVWDVTKPASPNRLAVIQPTTVALFTNTHKSWWECDTGVAYLVAGAGAASAAPDGWTTNQHIKIYDLTDPARPRHIRDIGLVGQNPRSAAVTATTGVHGPISIRNNPVTGEAVNRIYIPYGTSADGVLQIVDRLKVLPPAFGGTWDGTNALTPTDDQLRALVVGSMDMTPTEGAHTAFPIFGVPLAHYKWFSSNATRDVVALVSEEVDNHCQGSPHLAYLVDATRAKGKAAASAAENHPMVISTMQVFEDSSKEDFCKRGTRFGTHSSSESFYAPYYGKLVFVAWFNGGLRVFDIRDPYRPQEVAHFVPPVNANTRPTTVTIDGVQQTFSDVSTDNVELDDRGLIYIVDRVGGGADILQLTGCAKDIIDKGKVCNGKDG